MELKVNDRHQVFARLKPNRDKPERVMIPAPISYHAPRPDEEGVLMRHLFTVDGTVRSLVVEINRWVGKGKLEVLVTNSIIQRAQTILNPGKGRYSVDELEVKAGDKVLLKYTPVEEGDTCGDVWVAFMFNVKKA